MKRLQLTRLHPAGLLLAIVLFLAGCGQSAPTETPTPAPSATPALTTTATESESSTPASTTTSTQASSSTPASTSTLTSTPNPSLTPSPAPTRAPAIPEAGIELISALPDGCVNTDQTQSTVSGFHVIYHTVTTGNYQTGTLVAPDGEVLGTVDSEAENRDGDGLWGFYPAAYDYPANTPLTMTLTTYSGADATTPVSSISTLTYNCTTGQAISQTYTRGE